MDLFALGGVLALSFALGLLAAGGALTFVLFLMTRNQGPAWSARQPEALRDAIVQELAA